MSERPEPESDADLDFDREVAAARERATEVPLTREEAGLSSRVGWGRSPIIAVAVIIVGVFLLVATWADFRYFLRVMQDAPRELGRVDDIYRDGAFTEDFDNEWVSISGDPDVQHAARTPTQDGWYGVLRLLKAEGKLFVAIPRAEKEAPTEFPGHFEGRMRRLGSTPQWEKLQQFIDAEAIVDLHDLEVDSIWAGSPRGLDGREVEVRGGDVLRIVAEFPVGIAQLGRATWPKREDAEQAVAALGLAWTGLDHTSMNWRFAVELEAGANLGALATKLEAGLDSATKTDIEQNRTDPKKGAVVLPRRVTYSAAFEDLAVSADVVEIPHGPDSPKDTGWRRVGDRLEAIAPAGGKLSVPRSQVAAIRLERALQADPDGYLVMVDQLPGSAWPSAVMFVGVFGVVMLNVWALVAVLRRRRAQAA